LLQLFEWLVSFFAVTLELSSVSSHFLLCLIRDHSQASEEDILCALKYMYVCMCSCMCAYVCMM